MAGVVDEVEDPYSSGTPGLIILNFYEGLHISLLLTIISRGDSLPTQHTCREPGEDYLSMMRRRVLEDFVYMSEAHVQIDQMTRRDGRDCPPRNLTYSLNNLPLCPTYQELDRDERRTPSDIIQTRCRCDRCAMRRRRHYKYVCEPVFRYIPVLMRVGCTNGIYDYMINEKEVSVACVCNEKLKSKMANRTVLNTQTREHSVTSDDERISKTDKMVTNSEKEQNLRPELEKMSEVLETLASVLDSAQTEIEEMEELQRKESSHETEKMPKTFESIEDTVDSTEDVQDYQSDLQVSETEKMPEFHSSREDILDLTDHEPESLGSRQQERTSIQTDKMPKDLQSAPRQTVFVPDHQKMPTDYKHTHEHGSHFTNQERMPE